MNEVFNIKELANYLHWSESTVRKLVGNKVIPSFRTAKNEKNKKRSKKWKKS